MEIYMYICVYIYRKIMYYIYTIAIDREKPQPTTPAHLHGITLHATERFALGQLGHPISI